MSISSFHTGPRVKASHALRPASSTAFRNQATQLMGSPAFQ